MITYAIIAFVFLVVFFFIASAVGTTRMLNRRRQMPCPVCQSILTVPRLSPFQRWKSELGIGSGQQPGFTLHCDRCSADFRFTTDFKLVGRMGERS